MLDLFLARHGQAEEIIARVSFRQKLRIFPRFLPPTEIRESINSVPDDALFQLFVVRVFEIANRFSSGSDTDSNWTQSACHVR